MQIFPTKIIDVFEIIPKVFTDSRGFFQESWNKKDFQRLCNLDLNFVQDNHSYSKKGVLRGLHYQLKKPQGKLLRFITGKVLDVVVDLRKNSNTFGQYLTFDLNHRNNKQLWVPPGCAHGFLVLSEFADLVYKTTEYYDPEDEQCIVWNDPDLNINWHLRDIKPQVSDKDMQGNFFSNSPIYE